MTLKEAKEEILRKSLYMLEKDESGKKYICPICCNGSDEGEKGLLTQDKVHFTCPYKCFENATILEMVGLKSRINKEEQVIRILAHEMKITIDDEVKDETQEKKQANAAKLVRRTKSTEHSEIDYSLFYKECIGNIHKCDFLKQNTLNKVIQEQFEIGYCDKWIHPNTSDEMRKYIVATPRLIIPMTNASYLAISIGDDNNISRTQRVGKHTLFNIGAICDGNEPLYVVYDEMEALSIIECGYDAVAIGGKPELLYDALKNNECNRLLILSLGEDEDRQQLVATMENKLEEMRYDYIIYNLVSNFRSISEALRKNKKKLEESIDKSIDTATEFELKKVKEYQASNSNRYYFDNFIKTIFREKEVPVLTTGLKKLDEFFDGGLYKGLYVIEGNSSIGKTSFAIQMADNIVEKNKYTDVLIFSLETSRNELIAKSLSRLTAQAVMKKEMPLDSAKTIREVTCKELYTNEKCEGNILIKEACKRYGEYASHIYIYEGNENMGIMEIRKEIEKHVAHTIKARHKVVAIIDYIQIMSSVDDKTMTDKQKAYMNIVELKRISRDMNIPIIGISSMANSEDEVSAKSSCDAIIRLHIKDDDNNNCNIESEMKKSPRNMELKILKNRNGEALDAIDMVYYPQYSLFENEEYKK